MRSYALTVLVAGGALAAPRPQGLDFAAIDAAIPIPEPSVPVVDAKKATSVVNYVPTAAAASASAAVQANPSDTSIKVKRDNSACAQQPGSDDTAENFLSMARYSEAANSAVTPAGYSLSFQDLKASSNAMGYMGYSVLDSYDVDNCASRCNAIIGCSAFNIYFERDPAVDPTASCTNPPSEQVIKCVYWGGPVTAATAVNDGQYRRDFHVVIAGSNGYTSNAIETPPGYGSPTFLGDAAINAPLDCNGDDTYMGVKIFDGIFDAGRCAAACSSQSEYNTAHPPADKAPQTCQFFNTYVLFKNNEPVGQYCSLYSESWSPAFATNRGQYRGDDKYTIAYSFSFSNSTAGADQPKGCTNPSSPQ